MTPSDVLFPGLLVILFVVAWFVFGLVDSTRDDARAHAEGRLAPAEQPSTSRP